MIHSLARARHIHTTLRYALSGAAMSLALAAFMPKAQAGIVVCVSDGAANFQCGDEANASGIPTLGSGATAVGEVAGATSLGHGLGAAAFGNLAEA